MNSSTVYFSVRNVQHKELNNTKIVYFSTGLSVSQALYNVLTIWVPPKKKNSSVSSFLVSSFHLTNWFCHFLRIFVIIFVV